MFRSTYFLISFIILLSMRSYALTGDSTFFFKSALSVTNNGFSIIPAFTLGKPAAQFDMGIGNKRLSFEPQFRYALEGRPWSFIFIYRYKAITKDKFQLTFGGHLPGINFFNSAITTGGKTETYSVSRRFMAAEILPTYIINKQVNVGLYFLRGHGFQSSGPRNSLYLALRSTISKVKLGNAVWMDFSPQVFMLSLDNTYGFYANASVSLGIKKFPVSISSIVNKAIHSDIVAKDFDWNISLVYSINKQYTLRR